MRTAGGGPEEWGYHQGDNHDCPYLRLYDCAEATVSTRFSTRWRTWIRMRSWHPSTVRTLPDVPAGVSVSLTGDAREAVKKQLDVIPDLEFEIDVRDTEDL